MDSKTIICKYQFLAPEFYILCSWMKGSQQQRILAILYSSNAIEMRDSTIVILYNPKSSKKKRP